MSTRENKLDIYTISRDKISHVFCDYLYWVLTEAQKRGIKDLYFLARDGYILKIIAEQICINKHIKIKCNYFYCSRKSLRTPLYHIIGDEMYDQIFLGGYHVTLNSFFDRAGIDINDCKDILKEIGINNENEINKTLTNSQINKYKNIFKKSEKYKQKIFKNSKYEYKNTVGYFQQEGMLNNKRFGIVDSGWTGSMQRSIRQIINSTGYKPQITGFYFGMYVNHNFPEDGEYLTWYFSAKNGKKNKILFCNNLLESFLSAPHGMTIGYIYEDKYKPKLLPSPVGIQKEMIDKQISGLLTGAESYINSGLMTRGKKNSEKILRKLMGKPTPEVVKVYGKFEFCDDITEKYTYALAEANNKILDYTIFKRIKRKLSKQNKGFTDELFWPYGSAALLDSKLKKHWIWINLYLWNWIVYTFKNR